MNMPLCSLVTGWSETQDVRDGVNVPSADGSVRVCVCASVHKRPVMYHFPFSKLPALTGSTHVLCVCVCV